MSPMLPHSPQGLCPGHLEKAADTVHFASCGEQEAAGEGAAFCDHAVSCQSAEDSQQNRKKISVCALLPRGLSIFLFFSQ